MCQLLPLVRQDGLDILALVLASVLHEQQGGGGLDRAVGEVQVEVNRLDTGDPPRLVPDEGGDPSLRRRPIPSCQSSDSNIASSVLAASISHGLALRTDWHSDGAGAMPQEACTHAATRVCGGECHCSDMLSSSSSSGSSYPQRRNWDVLTSRGFYTLVVFFRHSAEAALRNIFLAASAS